MRDPSQTERLNLVTVRGLFGVFNHEIPLNLDERITIIHGPNGVGKTIMLRMIYEVLRMEPDVLTRVPFEHLELRFESGKRISVMPPWVETEGGLRFLVLDGNRNIAQGEYPRSQVPALLVTQIRDLVGPWEPILHGKWRDERDGEILNAREFLARWRHAFPPSLRRALQDDPGSLVEREFEYSDQFEVLKDLCDRCPVRLIVANRLTESSKYTRHTRSQKLSTVELYSRDLQQRISAVLSQYGELTTQLDRSLVRRLVSRAQDTVASATELKELLSDIDAQREHLVKLGLLVPTEDPLPGPEDEEIGELLSKSAEVLTLYVHDMREKFSLFDDLQTKLEILQGRTNTRFLYKSLVVDPDKGFHFATDTGERLEASDLSSGEQHEVILLYKLLFMVDEGDLVLIDEPEISLHLEWQMELLEDLRAAFRVSKVDVLIATHSPSIASSAPEALVPLGLETN